LVPSPEETNETETIETQKPVAKVKRTRSTTKKAQKIDQTPEPLPLINETTDLPSATTSENTIVESENNPIPGATLKRTRSNRATKGTPIPAEALTSINQSIKKQRTKSKLEMGTKNLTNDLNNLLNQSDENDENEEEGFDIEKLSAPIKPKGRMTKAREIEWVKLERQRIVRLKLAQIENSPDEVDVDQDRPRVVKFSETVIVADAEEQIEKPLLVERMLEVVEKKGKNKKDK